MKNLVNYFLQGLLFVVPIAATVYVIVNAFKLVDGLLEFDFPGLGLLIIVAGITILGYLSKFYFSNPFFSVIERLIERAPLVKIVYSSAKDMMEAFVGEKKRFNQPVLVTLRKESDIQQFGFITQEDLAHFDIKEKVAVYIPMSYSFAGNLYIVPKENIAPIKASGTEVMKFIVSGGVTEM